MVQLIQQNTMLFLFIVGIISLIVGSFLNVVITRLPHMLENMTRNDCQSFLSIQTHVEEPNAQTFNLFIPGSHCPKCKHKIKPWDNIPIISFLLLNGNCRHCKQPISLAYPATEALTLLLSIFIAWKLGVTVKSVGAIILIWLLITQAAIDLKCYMIPDEITIPAVWLGLIINCFAIFNTPQNAIYGAVAGYLSLWTIYWLFKFLTKKEGMGYGDFKLLAMLGAWLGWQQIPLIIMIASFSGAIIGITLIMLKRKCLSSAIPFGPYLAIAGLIALLYGVEINTWYLQYLWVM